MHRWALKMMAYDMVLKWRKGTDHIAPDALSRLRRKGPKEPDVDTTLPGDDAETGPTKGPEEPVLDGVPLQSMATPREEDEEAEALPELALLDRTPEEIRLDGICLADLGPTEINDRMEENLAVFYALQLTPDALRPTEEEFVVAYEQAQQLFTTRKPRAAVLGRGSGGVLQAVAGLLDTACVVDLDWKTFECIRVNGGAGATALIRQPPDPSTCLKILGEYRPEVLLGNACGHAEDPEGGGRTMRTADAIVKTFVASQTQVLVMESPVGFSGTDSWTNSLHPELHLAGCTTETASLSATSVGVPTTKRRLFAVAVKKNGDDNLTAKLSKWKKNMERPAPSPPTVGAFLGRRGCFFLKRGHQAREIFSFEEPAVTITREHVMGRKPPKEAFTNHPRDAGSLEEAQELRWED